MGPSAPGKVIGEACKVLSINTSGKTVFRRALRRSLKNALDTNNSIDLKPAASLMGDGDMFSDCV